MKMPDDIEQAMARLDRAIGEWMDIEPERMPWTSSNAQDWYDSVGSELMRASADLLNRIRREQLHTVVVP